MGVFAPNAGRLQPTTFDALSGFGEDDALAAFEVFAAFARGLEDRAPLRAARPASAALREVLHAALVEAPGDTQAARRFFVDRFRPFRVFADVGARRGFLTGYYEPWVAGSLTPTRDFTAPILARPKNLVTFAPGEVRDGFEPGISGAQRDRDGTLRPYPDRAAIEDAAENPLLWLADPVEVFLIQVQGSARVRLPDGRLVRLVYDGRNGLPYTSIGRLLIEAGEIPEPDMSLARLKAWLRANGLRPGERGRELMRRNRSYVFFRIDQGFDAAAGPIGGAGVPLVPLRSIAVDRSIWSYGTAFWIDARLPWRTDAPAPFRRLTIAADTGSAIVGPARADLFFGGGEEAGARAGAIRHEADFVALLPIGDEA